jgi:hypothetical protein
MNLDLTDDEERALVQLLRRAMDEERYFLSPRLDPLKAILAKLDPPAPKPEPLPAAGGGRQTDHEGVAP